ncbi:MAG: hypothetical protein AB7L17_00735 [Ilumatobacteraceae bacterium]
MTDTPPPGFGDLFTSVLGVNPFAGVQKSFGQFQRGVTQFLDSLETLNATMVRFNEIAERVTRLLDDVEPPIRALMPQVTRTVQAAESLPKDLADLINLLGDVARRLQPLGQLAESAGGLFGLTRLPRLRPEPAPEPPPPPPPAKKVPRKAPAKKAAAKKTPAKRPAR